MNTILKDVQDAMAFLGQAQEAAPPQSELWVELGRLWDELDNLADMIDKNEYNEKGEYIA